jgi:hypothetical protein
MIHLNRIVCVNGQLQGECPRDRNDVLWPKGRKLECKRQDRGHWVKGGRDY